MFAPLALVFLVVPFVELLLIIKVGQEIGALNTLGLLVLISLAGAWLVRREGMGVLERAITRVQMGETPGRELIDGVLILFAGALLITPGFLSDLFGILLLLPGVRLVFRGQVLRFLARRARLRIYR